MKQSRRTFTRTLAAVAVVGALGATLTAGVHAQQGQPVKIGLSALLVLAGASARWRGGFVRAWVLGSLLRRLIWR